MPDVEEKQCRICFEGEDPVMGRLIRPCLCKGSVKVWLFVIPPFPCAHTITVRSCILPHSLAQLFPKFICIFFLSSMPLSLSFWSHTHHRNCHQPRFVMYLSGLVLTHPCFRLSRGWHLVFNSLHSYRVFIVFHHDVLNERLRRVSV
jgi:hypothetical protein